MTPSQKYYKSIKDDRNDWKDTRIQQCMCCNKSGCQLDIHEIERRSSAPNRWWRRSNGLLLCRQCHDEKFNTMPHSRQLAVKLLRDPEYFDLLCWLDIGRRPERYVEPQEILDAVQDILQSGI